MKSNAKAQKSLLLAGVGFLILAFLAFLFQPSKPQKEWLGELLGSQAQPWVLKWQEGDVFRYRIDYENRGRFSFNSLMSGQKTSAKLEQVGSTEFSFSLTQADLVLTVVKAYPQRYDLSYVIEGGDLMIHFGPRQQALEQQIKAAIQRPHELQIRYTGAIETFQFDSETPTIARNMLQQLLRDLLPRLEKGLVEERVLNGRREVETVYEPCTSDSCRFEKKIRRFKPAKQGNEYNIEGSFFYDLKDGHLQAANGERSLKISSNSQLLSQDQLKISAKLMKHETLNALALLAHKKWLSGSQASQQHDPGFDEALMQHYRKLVKNTSFEAEKDRFRMAADGSDITELRDVFDKLFAFAKLHPELLEELAQFMGEFDPASSKFDILGVLLAKYGTLESQQLLMDAMDRYWQDEEAVGQLAFNFSLMQDVKAEIASEFLDKLDATPPTSPNYRHMLLHAAGMAFHSEQKEVKDRVFQMASAVAKSESSRELGLVALGNLGHEQTLDTVRSDLGSEDERRRAYAAHSLRRVKGPKEQIVTETLTDIAIKDSSADVRREATRSLHGRSLGKEQIEQLATRLYEERDPAAAIYILETLDANKEYRSEIRQHFEDYFRACGHPKVCQKLESILLSGAS